jgi:predicted ATP-grasp superfamily ATP-dependent carboligase
VEQQRFVHPAIVLGLGQNGLATVRALARQGISVIGVDGNLRQPTAHTRLCQKVVCRDFRGEGLLQCLLELGRTLPAKGVLFPSGDISLELISERREVLNAYYLFALPAKEVIRLALNKREFYRFAKQRGYLVPLTAFPRDEAEVEEVSREIPYPCLLKPFQPDASWRQRFPDVKAFEVASPQDLMRYYRALRRLHPEILVQEVIPGPDSRLFFSLTYFDGQRVLGMFTGRKLRQFPPYYGTSCMAESIWNPWVAEETVRLLKELGYRGYGSVEFKWDPRDERFKIIEFTPRTWFPHGLSTACGVNLPYTMYQSVLGLPVEEPRGFPEGVRWIHEERDLQSALRMWRQGKLTVREWLASYRGRRTYALAAWDDAGPLLAALLHLLRQLASLVRWRRTRGTNDLLTAAAIREPGNLRGRGSVAK